MLVIECIVNAELLVLNLVESFYETKRLFVTLEGGKRSVCDCISSCVERIRPSHGLPNLPNSWT